MRGIKEEPKKSIRPRNPETIINNGYLDGTFWTFPGLYGESDEPSGVMSNRGSTTKNR